MNQYTIICPSCGEKVHHESNYCMNCSQKLMMLKVKPKEDFKFLVDDFLNTSNSLIDSIRDLLEDDLFKLTVTELNKKKGYNT